MNKINNLNITDLIFGSMEEHDAKLSDAIDSNPEYMEAVNKVKEHYEKLKELAPEMWFEMDSDITTMEVASRDIAFNEGFKLAIKLILSSVQ